jgi:hypothetical protein
MVSQRIRCLEHALPLPTCWEVDHAHRMGAVGFGSMSANARHGSGEAAAEGVVATEGDGGTADAEADAAAAEGDGGTADAEADAAAAEGDGGTADAEEDAAAAEGDGGTADAVADAGSVAVVDGAMSSGMQGSQRGDSDAPTYAPCRQAMPSATGCQALGL